VAGCRRNKSYESGTKVFMIHQLVPNNTCVLHVVAHHPEGVILAEVAMHPSGTSLLGTFHCQIFLA
jgi:hypothetical protein